MTPCHLTDVIDKYKLVENYCIWYTLLQCFLFLKRRDKTPRTSRGKTLSIDSMELAVSESELYLDIMTL
jgi:hypothetical protein